MTRINAIRNTASSIDLGKEHRRRCQRLHLRRCPDHLLRNRRMLQRQAKTRNLQQPDSRDATPSRSSDARSHRAGREQAGS